MLVELESAGSATPQSVWAELLTGKEWKANGCVGYAYPNRSLNDLKIFSEKDLLSPCLVTPDREDVISINLPLVLPGKRIWVGDGSMPLAPAMSSAAKAYVTEPYKPRAYSTIATALFNRYTSLEADFDKDRNEFA